MFQMLLPPEQQLRALEAGTMLFTAVAPAPEQQE